MPPRLRTTTQPTTTNQQNKVKSTNLIQSNSQSNSNQTNSPPKTIPTTQNPQSNRLAIEQFAQAVHLIEGFADTLDAIPPSLTRSLSDLKELDAVLSGPLNQVHSRLDQLLNSFQNPDAIRPDQRLQLLQNIVSDIEKYNLGGQDKIRVANGTCESLAHHIRQLDTTTSLLISSLPPSLEPRIPASSFPSGYPKLTGSLRSKPVGGVWHNSTHSIPVHPLDSPPSIAEREFINSNHQQSPSREAELHARSIDIQSVSKRDRIGPSASIALGASSHLNPIHPDESNQIRKTHQPPAIGNKLLEQHMIFSQSSVKKHRLPQESVECEENLPGDQLMNVDHLINGPAGKSTSSGLSRQNSQLSLVASPPHPTNLLSTGTKNKRARITSNLTGNSVNYEDCATMSHPPLKVNGPPQQSPSTPQQPTTSGTKKRARKSNLIGPVGKNPDSTDQVKEDLTNLTKRLIDSTTNPNSTHEPGVSRTVDDHHKSINSNPIGGPSIKKSSVTGSRGANNNKNGTATVDQPVLPVPVTTKRTYTKRNGMNNGGVCLSKSKRVARKKAVGVPPPSLPLPPTEQVNPNSSANSTELQVRNHTKTEHNFEQQRSRVKQTPVLKESVRLEDVVEGAKNKARHRKLNSGTHSVSSGNQPDGGDMKREKESVGMEDEEDEEEAEKSHDDGDQNRSKYHPEHKDLSNPMDINPQQPSSCIKNKSNMSHQFQLNPSNRRPNEDGKFSLTDPSLTLKKNRSNAHRDPNMDISVDMLSPKDSIHSNDSARTYCFCKGDVYGDRMVACDNAECPIEWFHYQCAGLTEDPTGNWFCPDCKSKGFGRTIGRNVTQTSGSHRSKQGEGMVGVEIVERRKEGSMVMEGGLSDDKKRREEAPLQDPTMVGRVDGLGNFKPS